jgi:hypothetical protein
MAELIKTITDKSLFEKIFYKFFLKKDVFLKTKNGDLKIEFFGYTDGMAALRIPYLKNMYESCLIFTRNESYTIYANLKLVEKQEDDSYIFIPIKFQIISTMRREDRKIVDIGGEGKNIIYITSVISDFIIQNSLAMENKKVDHVKEIVRFDLEKQFKHVRIFFCNEGMTDVRMKYFYENKTPYLISDINKKESAKDESLLTITSTTIRQGLPSHQPEKPHFRGVGARALQGPDSLRLHTVQRRRAAVGIGAAYRQAHGDRGRGAFYQVQVFPISDERLLVSDVSKRG